MPSADLLFVFPRRCNQPTNCPSAHRREEATRSAVPAVARQYQIHEALFTKVSIWHQRVLLGDWGAGDAVLCRMSRGPAMFACGTTDRRKRAPGQSSEIVSPVRGESCASHLRSAQTENMKTTTSPVWDKNPSGNVLTPSSMRTREEDGVTIALWCCTRWPRKVKMLIGHPNGLFLIMCAVRLIQWPLPAHRRIARSEGCSSEEHIKADGNSPEVLRGRGFRMVWRAQFTWDCTSRATRGQHRHITTL